YEMSRRIANATWIQLAFSGLLPAGIVLFHHTLQEVILVQLLLMLGLLLAVSVPLWPQLFPVEGGAMDRSLAAGFATVRSVTEAEVIAEFLRAEFYQPEFDPYRNEFGDVVADSDLFSQRKNAIRKTLLFRRRGKLWRELPTNTQWWEIELRSSDLPRVR